MKTKTRIAPTPSGFLHIGNAINFILTALLARLDDGEIVLRIDDMDSTRCRREYVEDIFYILNWLGITYDQGPKNADDFFKNFSQSNKTDHYRAYLRQLKDSIYFCDCSRQDILKRTGTHEYDGHCKSLHKSPEINKTATRFVDGDFVIWRKDDLPAYQLVSTIEDHELGINLIVRGADLKPSTQMQLKLAKALGFDDFATIQFIHHRLILDETGDKLSKSNNSMALKNIATFNSNPSYVYQLFTTTFNLPPADNFDSLLKEMKHVGIHRTTWRSDT